MPAAGRAIKNSHQIPSRPTSNVHPSFWKNKAVTRAGPPTVKHGLVQNVHHLGSQWTMNGSARIGRARRLDHYCFRSRCSMFTAHRSPCSSTHYTSPRPHLASHLLIKRNKSRDIDRTQPGTPRRRRVPSASSTIPSIRLKPLKSEV